MSKLVSVIIPAYQASSTIGRTLASLFAQTYTNVEVIVVDDASTDALEAAIAPWRERLTYLRLPVRSDAPHARNTGYQQARGELVMFCDADLILVPEAIAKLVAALEMHPEAAYAYPSFRFGWKKFRCGPWDAERLRRRNFIHTSALIRREATPAFDETLRRFQDWDLWLTLLREGKRGVWVPEVLYRAMLRKRGLAKSSWRPSFWYAIPWDQLGFIPASVLRYREAARIVQEKHQLLAGVMKKEGSAGMLKSISPVFLRALEFAIILELSSFLAYFVPWLRTPLLFGVLVGVAVIASRNLAAGLACILVELLIGSHGHMLDHAAAPLSLRTGLFAVVMLVWAYGVFRKRYRILVPMRYALLLLPVLFGVSFGLIAGRGLGTVFADANAYLFLLLALPLASVASTLRFADLVQVFSAGLSWLAVKTFALLYVFSHFGPDVIRPTYKWVRDTRVAEVTRFLGAFHRVFLPSHLALIPGVGALAAKGVFAQGRREFRIALLGLAALAAVFLSSLSRSIAIGCAVTLLVFLGILLAARLVRKQELGRFVALFAGAAVLGGILATVLINIPIPHRTNFISVGNVLEERGTLSDAAVGARWALLGPLWSKILVHPWFGSGFGADVTYISPDPFVRDLSPDGVLTTSAFEWGYLEMWLKMGFLGLASILAFLGFLGRQLFLVAYRSARPVSVALFAAYIGLLVTHIFTPYLNHPLGLGMLLVLDFFSQKTNVE